MTTQYDIELNVSHEDSPVPTIRKTSSKLRRDTIYRISEWFKVRTKSEHLKLIVE
jgi:hypothetical protein